MSQEESLYDLLHNERANALRNSEKFLAAVEYFKGRADMENDLIFNEESRKEKHETFKNFSL